MDFVFGPQIDAIVALAAVILVFVGFTLERLPPQTTALVGVAGLVALGALSTEDMLSVLSNSAPATIAAIFIIGAALTRSGALDVLSREMRRRAADQPLLMLVALLAGAMVLSAFVNNTPVAMVLIPVAISLAGTLQAAPSRLLIPLSYVTILGGMCTLFGTSTNLLVDGVARAEGLAPFGVFEVTPIGLAAAGAGVLYLTVIGPFLLPSHGSVAAAAIASRRQGSARFLIEAFIGQKSPLVGQRLTESRLWAQNSIRVIDVLRGDLSLRRALSEVVLREGDRVVLRADAADLAALREDRAIDMSASERSGDAGSAGDGAPSAVAAERTGAAPGTSSPGPSSAGASGQGISAPITAETRPAELTGVDVGGEPLQPVQLRQSTLMEVLVAPGSPIIGRQLGNLRIRRRYGVYPVAAHRRGHNLAARLETTPMEAADTLLFEGAPEDLRRVADDFGLIALSEPPDRSFRPEKAPLAIAALLGMVLVASFGLLPIAGAAVIGAAVVLAAKCIDLDEALSAIDGGLLLLIYAMLAMGKALETSGAAALLVSGVEPLMAMAPPILLLITLYLLCSLLTELVTNNAVAVIMTPIAIKLGVALGHDPRALALVVMVAASASFATPIGYQTNTLVYAAGGYRFADFLRIGAPLNILIGLVASTTIYALYF